MDERLMDILGDKTNRNTRERAGDLWEPVGRDLSVVEDINGLQPWSASWILKTSFNHRTVGWVWGMGSYSLLKGGQGREWPTVP